MRGNVFADEIQKTIRAGYVRNSWNEEIYFLSFCFNILQQAFVCVVESHYEK